jgi:hypothetical protein
VGTPSAQRNRPLSRSQAATILAPLPRSTQQNCLSAFEATIQRRLPSFGSRPQLSGLARGLAAYLSCTMAACHSVIAKFKEERADWLKARGIDVFHSNWKSRLSKLSMLDRKSILRLSPAAGWIWWLVPIYHEA